jgi:hypothetical protein
MGWLKNSQRGCLADFPARHRIVPALRAAFAIGSLVAASGWRTLAWLQATDRNSLNWWDFALGAPS